MSHIKETERCFDKLDDVKKTLCCWAESAISNGMAAANADELGAVVDMVKDLSCAQKDIWESCYYKTVVDAMKTGEETGYAFRPELMYGYPNDRMGYNPNRNAKGQYSRGYYPGDDVVRWPVPQMGYSASEGKSLSASGADRDVYSRMMPMLHEDEDSERYGREFGRYRQARRHYTETRSPAEKKKMDDHAEHHMNEAIATFKEIWKEADPELRNKMKTDLTKLMGEMN